MLLVADPLAVPSTYFTLDVVAAVKEGAYSKLGLTTILLTVLRGADMAVRGILSLHWVIVVFYDNDREAIKLGVHRVLIINSKITSFICKDNVSIIKHVKRYVV
jgi:hypothetical protein